MAKPRRKVWFYMRAPKMVLFDYGQTLVNEQPFDGVAGNRAVMQYATKNKHHYTPEQVRSAAEALNLALGRFDPEKQHLFQVEIPNRIFQAFLYQSMGIEISLTPQEMDRIFWDAAAPGVPTEGIAELPRPKRSEPAWSATSPTAAKS